MEKDKTSSHGHSERDGSFIPEKDYPRGGRNRDADTYGNQAFEEFSEPAAQPSQGTIGNNSVDSATSKKSPVQPESERTEAPNFVQKSGDSKGSK